LGRPYWLLQSGADVLPQVPVWARSAGRDSIEAERNMYPLRHLEQGCGRQTGTDLPLPEVSEGAGVAGEFVVVQVGGLAGGTDVVGGGRGKLVVAGNGMVGYSTRIGVGLGTWVVSGD